MGRAGSPATSAGWVIASICPAPPHHGSRAAAPAIRRAKRGLDRGHDRRAHGRPRPAVTGMAQTLPSPPGASKASLGILQQDRRLCAAIRWMRASHIRPPPLQRQILQRRPHCPNRRETAPEAARRLAPDAQGLRSPAVAGVETGRKRASPACPCRRKEAAARSASGCAPALACAAARCPKATTAPKEWPIRSN